MTKSERRKSERRKAADEGLTAKLHAGVTAKLCCQVSYAGESLCHRLALPDSEYCEWHRPKV